MISFSQEMRTLFRILGDRQWHSHREVKKALAASIGPGKALRKYEDRVMRRRERLGTNPMPTEPSETEKIIYGQNLVADAVLQTSKRNYLEIADGGGGFGERHVRLRPGVEIPAGAPLQGQTERAAERVRTTPPSADPEEAAEDPDGHAEDYWKGLQEVIERAMPGAGERVAEIAATRLTPETPFVAAREPAAREPAAPPAEKEEMALFREDEVRALVAQEVGLQLDAFQSGLQTWLAEQIEVMRTSACVLHSLPRRR